MIYRIIVFCGVFALMALWEGHVSRRPSPNRRSRWPINLGIAAINLVLARGLAFALVYLISLLASNYEVGLFHYVDWPAWLEIVLAMLILDFGVWLQHLAMHHFAFLWRLHKLHHSDPILDVTSALRFHPLEIALSLAYKLAIVVALGAPPVAVLLFEIILNGAAMFHHANISLGRFDKPLRLLLVSPDMHQIHHSTDLSQQRRNFSFSLSLWDRLFRTFSAPPVPTSLGLTEETHKTFADALAAPWKVPDKPQL